MTFFEEDINLEEHDRNNFNTGIYKETFNFTKIEEGIEQKLNNLRVDTIMFLIFFTTYSNALMTKYAWSLTPVLSRTIEKLLFYFGSCCVIRDGGKLKPYRYIITEWDKETAEPLTITAVDLKGNQVKRDINKKDFVIIYDNINSFPLVFTTWNYCAKFARTHRAIDSNVSKQFIPILFHGTPEQKKALEELARKYEQGVNYWFLDKDYMNNISTLNLNVEFKGLELYDLLDRQRNEFETLVGIDNENVNKASGVSEFEIEANDEFLDSVKVSAEFYRKSACKEIKEKFGEEWTVTKIA